VTVSSVPAHAKVQEKAAFMQNQNIYGKQPDLPGLTKSLFPGRKRSIVAVKFT